MINGYENHSCNSSLSTSFNYGLNSEEEIDKERISPFAEPDEIVEEASLEVDEAVVKRSASPDPPFVFTFDASEREGVECVRRAVEQLGGEVISGTEPVVDADDEGKDAFVDVVGGGQRDASAESEGFTFANVFKRANLFSETVLEGVVCWSELPLC